MHTHEPPHESTHEPQTAKPISLNGLLLRPDRSLLAFLAGLILVGLAAEARPILPLVHT